MLRLSLDGSAFSFGVGNATYQNLVDFVGIDVDDLEAVSAPVEAVGALGDLSQHIHHEARNSFIVLRVRQFIQIERVDQIDCRSGAVDEPAMIVAFDDLAFLRRKNEFTP